MDQRHAVSETHGLVPALCLNRRCHRPRHQRDTGISATAGSCL
jgi:hypothetical protein